MQMPFGRSRTRTTGMIGIARHDGVLSLARGQGQGWTGCECDVDPEQLAPLVRQHRLRRSAARLVLDRRDFRLLPTEAPDVPEAELCEAIRWQVADLVDFDVSDAVVDYCPMGDTHRHDGKRLVYAVVAPQAAVRDAIHMARRAGLRVDQVGIPELCLRNLAAQLPQAKGGVALLYAQADGATVVLVRGERLFVTRHVEVQLNDESGTAFDSVLLEIQRALDYFDGHFAHPPIRQLAVMGDEPVEAAAVQHLGSNLRMEAQWVSLSTFQPEAGPGGRGCAFALGATLEGR
ncbi:type IV pilus biogenesis protein PilM [Thioalkalivibrio sp.]|uniref:type IV pilus biogenesis protein PilM n=1 Tax=Thioalkalivibrio sp. TaxID=2093813 RepID=UPI0035613C97